jgi:hypothetical protein
MNPRETAAACRRGMGQSGFAREFRAPTPSTGGFLMAKPNYAFAKRQRELAKKQKKEAKQKQKMADQAPDTTQEPVPPQSPEGGQP